MDCKWEFEQCPGGCEPHHLKRKCNVDGERGFILTNCAGSLTLECLNFEIQNPNCNLCCMNHGCTQSWYSGGAMTTTSEVGTCWYQKRPI